MSDSTIYNRLTGGGPLVPIGAQIWHTDLAKGWFFCQIIKKVTEKEILKSLVIYRF